jgi:hypothetical protein
MLTFSQKVVGAHVAYRQKSLFARRCAAAKQQQNRHRTPTNEMRIIIMTVVAEFYVSGQLCSAGHAETDLQRLARKHLETPYDHPHT